MFDLHRRRAVLKWARRGWLLSVPAHARAHAASKRLVADFVAVEPERVDGLVAETPSFDVNHGFRLGSRFCIQGSKIDRLERERDDFRRAVVFGRIRDVFERVDFSAFVSCGGVDALAKFNATGCVADSLAVSAA